MPGTAIRSALLAVLRSTSAGLGAGFSAAALGAGLAVPGFGFVFASPWGLMSRGGHRRNASSFWGGMMKGLLLATLLGRPTPTELSPRTFWTFLRGLSSPPRTPRTVLVGV